MNRLAPRPLTPAQRRALLRAGAGGAAAVLGRLLGRPRLVLLGLHEVGSSVAGLFPDALPVRRVERWEVIASKPKEGEASP